MEPTNSKRRKMDPEKFDPPGTSILQINYDCLLKVFSFFNVLELLVIEKVCTTFKNLADDCYEKYRVLHVDEIKPNNIRLDVTVGEEIFRRVGPYVEQLRMSYMDFQSYNSLQYVWEYCKKLKSIHLKGYSFCLVESYKLSKVFENVKHVYLDVSWSGRVSENDLFIMFDLRKLKKLTIVQLRRTTFRSNRPPPMSGLTGIKGHYLMKLQDIEELNVPPYSFPESKNLFLDFCKNITQIRSLNLHNWLHDENDVQIVVSNLRNLEKLTLFTYGDVQKYLPLMDMPTIRKLILGGNAENCSILLLRIAPYNRLEELIMSRKTITPEVQQGIEKLTKLKKLLLLYVNDFTDHTLDAISCPETLQELHICGTKITSLGLARFIERFSYIQYINVASCKELTGDFIPRILEHLKGRPRKLVIKINSHCPFSPKDYEGMLNLNILEIVST